jgi:dihydroorotase
LTTKRSEAIIIQKGRLYTPKKGYSPSLHIRIKNGILTEIGEDLKPKPEETVIDAEDCIVFPGLVDGRARSGDPGDEHKEDLMSTYKSASSGGATHVAVLPNTRPYIDSKAGVEYIGERYKNLAVKFLPIGAASKNLEGLELTEMFDMHKAGAVAFSNGDRAFQDGQALKRALLYAKSFNGLIMSHAMEPSLEAQGFINESKTTIHTGLKTSHSMAEYIQVQKEIQIAAYCEAPLHISHVSTKESVDIIRHAQNDGLNITCDVALTHLIFTDASMSTYNSSFKLIPPLRSEEDRKALIQGVKDGVITTIVSDHNPQNIESKDVEFDYAEPGASILPTFISTYCTHLSKELSWDDFLHAASTRPRALFGLPQVAFEVGEKADFCMFNEKAQWQMTKENNPSKSNNNPFLDQPLTGRCKATILGDVWHENPM